MRRETQEAGAGTRRGGQLLGMLAADDLFGGALSQWRRRRAWWEGEPPLAAMRGALRLGPAASWQAPLGPPPTHTSSVRAPRRAGICRAPPAGSGQEGVSAAVRGRTSLPGDARGASRLDQRDGRDSVWGAGREGAEPAKRPPVVGAQGRWPSGGICARSSLQGPQAICRPRPRRCQSPGTRFPRPRRSPSGPAAQLWSRPCGGGSPGTKSSRLGRPHERPQ